MTDNKESAVTQNGRYSDNDEIPGRTSAGSKSDDWAEGRIGPVDAIGSLSLPWATASCRQSNRCELCLVCWEVVGVLPEAKSGGSLTLSLRLEAFLVDV